MSPFLDAVTTRSIGHVAELPDHLRIAERRVPRKLPRRLETDRRFAVVRSPVPDRRLLPRRRPRAAERADHRLEHEFLFDEVRESVRDAGTRSRPARTGLARRRVAPGGRQPHCHLVRRGCGRNRRNGATPNRRRRPLRRESRWLSWPDRHSHIRGDRRAFAPGFADQEMGSRAEKTIAET